MTDRDALHAAILAYPDEDTPRLMFADWLEENGDARYAAFIRKQMELAKVPEWNPLWIRAWNQDRDAITGRHHKKFAPKKLPVGLIWLPLTSFRRGFPWQIRTAGIEPFLKHADKFATTMPLQALEVDGLGEWPGPMDLSELFACTHLARMKDLVFSLTSLAPESIRQMQESPHAANITSLTFEFSTLPAASLREVFQPPLIKRIESLRFDGCVSGWGSLASAVAKAGGPHRLKSFVLAYNTAMVFSPNTLFKAPLLRGLKEFEISEAEMHEHQLRIFCASPVVNGLESLTLNKTHPGVGGIEELAGCKALSGLKRLRLASNSIGAVGARRLADSPHLSGLQVLDLQGNPLGNKGAIALAKAPWLANLVELELMNCKIGDTGAEALMNAVSTEKIINLSLSSGDEISSRMRKKLRRKFGDRVFA